MYSSASRCVVPDTTLTYKKFLVAKSSQINPFRKLVSYEFFSLPNKFFIDLSKSLKMSLKCLSPTSQTCWPKSFLWNSFYFKHILIKSTTEINEKLYHRTFFYVLKLFKIVLSSKFSNFFLITNFKLTPHPPKYLVLTGPLKFIQMMLTSTNFNLFPFINIIMIPIVLIMLLSKRHSAIVMIINWFFSSLFSTYLNNFFFSYFKKEENSVFSLVGKFISFQRRWFSLFSLENSTENFLVWKILEA